MRSAFEITKQIFNSERNSCHQSGSHSDMNHFSARAVKDEPGSITAIAGRLHRDRSAVKRDVDILQAAGMVTVDEKILPGHGRMREVRVTAERLSLQAEVA